MRKLNIKIRQGSILDLNCDAIVNPSNSLGLMGGGVALAIKRAGGEVIEKEAISKAPIPVGSAIATSPGRLNFKAIIHASTMEQPAEKSSEFKVAQATKAALVLADSMMFKTLAFPGMGTGVGSLPVELASEAMLSEIFSFSPKNLNLSILVDLNPSLVEAWKLKLSGLVK